MDSRPVEYRWVEDEVDALMKIGLTRTGAAMDEFGCVWKAEDEHGGQYIAKLMKKGSTELAALLKMRSLVSPRNIFIPGHLLECTGSFVYVMPRLDDLPGRQAWANALTYELLLQHLNKIIDMVQLMHENDMAFIDISEDNVVYSKEGFSHGGFDIPAGAVYLIDLGSARLLPSGPGSGVKIYDWGQRPGGKRTPPEGTEAVDPYGYDIYMLSDLLWTFTVFWETAPMDGKRHVARCAHHFCSKVMLGDPAKRPSIFWVRRRFTALLSWMDCTAWTYRVLPVALADFISVWGWRFISIFAR